MKAAKKMKTTLMICLCLLYGMSLIPILAQSYTPDLRQSYTSSAEDENFESSEDSTASRHVLCSIYGINRQSGNLEPLGTAFPWDTETAITAAHVLQLAPYSQIYLKREDQGVDRWIRIVGTRTHPNRDLAMLLVQPISLDSTKKAQSGLPLNKWAIETWHTFATTSLTNFITIQSAPKQLKNEQIRFANLDHEFDSIVPGCSGSPAFFGTDPTPRGVLIQREIRTEDFAVSSITIQEFDASDLFELGEPQPIRSCILTDERPDVLVAQKLEDGRLVAHCLVNVDTAKQLKVTLSSEPEEFESLVRLTPIQNDRASRSELSNQLELSISELVSGYWICTIDLKQNYPGYTREAVDVTLELLAEPK